MFVFVFEVWYFSKILGSKDLKKFWGYPVQFDFRKLGSQ